MPTEDEYGWGVSKTASVAACTSMAVFYVAVLYFPTVVFRLPPPNSFQSFLIRRFFCAAISSLVSLLFSSLFLSPIPSLDASLLFGIRGDHVWRALVFPLALTSLMYSGSFALKLLSILKPSNQRLNTDGNLSVMSVKRIFLKFVDWAVLSTSSVSNWRNYFVAPLTEELVFRACMIPLLLCGGFSTYNVIFFCPIFFSLAHLNHLFELYVRENYNLLKACTIVGFQLGYTVIFGAYASFLFVRTGHITAPLIAHVFCNYMGLPVMFSRKSGIVVVAFVMGVLGFLWLLFPLTNPNIYNDKIDNCKCWHRYCSWGKDAVSS